MTLTEIQALRAEAKRLQDIANGGHRAVGDARIAYREASDVDREATRVAVEDAKLKSRLEERAARTAGYFADRAWLDAESAVMELLEEAQCHLRWWRGHFDPDACASPQPRTTTTSLLSRLTGGLTKKEGT